MERIVFSLFVLGLLFVISLFLFGMIFNARNNQQAVLYGVTIISLLGITLGAFWNQAKNARNNQMRLVLISVDGLHYKNLSFLPNLMKSFGRSYAVKGVTPTLTYPSHTTLITGVHPSVHGIRNNTIFDPQRIDSKAWQWYASDIKVPTLFDYCSMNHRTTMNIQWPVTVGNTNITYSLPVIWRSGSPEDLKLISSLMRPKVNLDALLKEKQIKSADDLSGIPGDEIRARIAKNWLYTYEPFFSAIYVGALDHVTHKFGPNSPEVRKTLSQLDLLLSDLVRFIQHLEPSCVIAIVSDHGFAPVHTTVDLYRDLKLDPRDVYIWLGDGSAAFYILPTAQRTLTRSALIMKLHALEYLDEVRAGGDEDGTFKGADVFVTLKLGYLLKETQHEQQAQKGGHGFSNRHPEMDAVLLLSANAPPFPYAPTSRISMTSIAPYLLDRVLFP